MMAAWDYGLSFQPILYCCHTILRGKVSVWLAKSKAKYIFLRHKGLCRRRTADVCSAQLESVRKAHTYIYVALRARIHRSLCKLLSPVTPAGGFACFAAYGGRRFQNVALYTAHEGVSAWGSTLRVDSSTRRIKTKPHKAVRDGDSNNNYSRMFCFIKLLPSPNFGTCACTEISTC